MNAVTYALSSFLPRLLLHRLAVGQTFVNPEVNRIEAAVLLSDIQGFTSLVASFATAGQQGLEELTRSLNTYFEDFVELIYSHGGDVLYITGDSVFCYWPAAGPGELPEVIVHAAQAGLTIQARLHGRPLGHNQQFHTRLGIGAGRLAIAFVGGTGGCWELIAGGDALNQAIQAEKQSAPGQVVLSPTAWMLVAARCEGGVHANDHMILQSVHNPPAPVPARLPPLLSNSDQILRPFLPPAVLARLPIPQAEWLAEQRTLTVLLADFPVLEDPTDEGLEQVHAISYAFQEVVQRFDGTIKVSVDNKGILLLAVFGLPPKAHEDNTERAIYAAWALKEALEQLGIRCGIGVATGRALCGAFGSDLRREYALCGEVINLASRLMQITTAEIVCDYATVRSVRGRLAFETLPAVVLKGMAQSVQVYRPIGQSKLTPRSNILLIGRAKEQAILLDQLAALQAGGKGGVVIVQAEAGFGKSRLVSSLSQAAIKAGVRVFTAAADAIDRSTAYLGWRSVFVSLFEVGSEIDPGTAYKRVAAYMTRFPIFERLLPLLSSVLPIQFADNELTVEMTGDVRADNTRRLLAGLIQDAADKAPTLLVLEDAHWLDSSSWALLLEVAQSVRPLLTVVTIRPNPDPQIPEYARLVSLAGDHVLWLEGLSSEEILAFIQHRLGVREVPPALAEFVQVRVAGNPFFCEEIIQAMLEAGIIIMAQDVCTVGCLSALNLPMTIEGVILSRLDRLAPGQLLCLKIASIIGRVFRSRTVCETHPFESERDKVTGHLEKLTDLRLTLPETPEPELSYSFNHEITRDVTYNLMPLAQRRPVHRAIAEWYERNYANDLSPYYSLIAYHWAQAADPTRTAEYLEKAGRQALRDGTFQEALLFFSQAIELAENGKIEVDRLHRALWEKGLGTAYYFLGDLQKSRLNLERAVALMDQPVPSRPAAVLQQALAAAVTQVCHRLLPSRYFGRQHQDKAVLDEMVDCYKMLGQIYYLNGEPVPQLTYLTLRGLNIGEEGGASPALACILSNAGVIVDLAGIKSWADWYADQAIQMAEKQGQYAAAAYVWHIRALQQAQRGNWSGAKISNNNAMKLIQELGDYSLEAEAWVVRATIGLCEGNFVTASSAWMRARELAERNGNAQILCWSLLDEVDTLLGCGKTDTAAQVLEAALSVETAASDGSSTIDKHRALAVTRLRQGRYAEAVRAADVVVDMISHQPPTGYHWVDCGASAVEVYLAVLESGGEYTRKSRIQLERRARKGCKILKRLSHVFWNVRPRSWLLRGLLLRQLDKHEQALSAYTRAERIAAKMDMPFERARALFEIGRLSETTEREACLSQAAEIYEMLGATYYLNQVAAARKQTK